MKNRDLAEISRPEGYKLLQASALSDLIAKGDKQTTTTNNTVTNNTNKIKLKNSLVSKESTRQILTKAKIQILFQGRELYSLPRDKHAVIVLEEDGTEVRNFFQAH